MIPFTGSYHAEDAIFLLKSIGLEQVDVATKERLIQSGARHYSEMLAPERVPDARYLALFEALTVRYAQRLAAEVMALATYLSQTRPRQVTVVSLARAGTPIGALLARALRFLGRSDVQHYSLSIIRDRGIDENALRFILRDIGREPAGVAFVDGWTAKGVIAAELRQAVQRWNARQPERLEEALHVVSDIGGVAEVAATGDDYAIPSGILNATVSGLTSRSILNTAIGPEDFHGCVWYGAFAAHDRSTWFLDQISPHFARVTPLPVRCTGEERQARRRAMQSLVEALRARYRIRDSNLIKPGVAEATRVLLRRLPKQLLLRDPADPDVEHLRLLAEEKRVALTVEPAMPLRAVALIQDLV